MREITNVNWNAERELLTVEDCTDEYIEETSHYVSFNYNGYNLIAVVDFTLDLSEYHEEDTNVHEISVDDTHVEVKELYEVDGDTFTLPSKEIINIEYKLQSDLLIQF